MNFLILFMVLSTFATLVENGIVYSLESRYIRRHLKDKTFVKKQLDCVLARGACDSVGKELQALIPKVLVNDCKKCSSEEAAHAKQLIVFMKTNYPDEWNEIVAKYITH